MPAPDSIVRLVQTFAQHRDQYRKSDFSEVSTRHQFIDPFFKALGWDVNNEEGNSEKYKEVVHEDKIKIGGATKAPDYSFRLGAGRVFFVEAKKPSVDISHEIDPAYQLRRYAWSAKLPLSILTDFEEFAVYDCRSKPEKSDKASTGRVMRLDHTQYVEKWDEIAAIFSKGAVKQGALDKFAEAKTGKRSTAQVDDEFLLDIEGWREKLARNLALRNPTLKGRELNWAVQQIIDRIVFLRICEDRGLEPLGQLQGLLNGQHTYERLQQIFRQADMRYNSGLFHFEPEKGRAESPDTLTPALAVDDKTLKEIITRLYFPDSPYEFYYIPPDILGHVYERFLGKVIRLTPGRQVKIEEKPEVRKAGGVFYTPTYIVDYIVRETVGPLLAATPQHPERSGGGSLAATQSKDAPPALRILDPACGSGSFLLGAYQFLLDWYLDQYRAAPARWLKGKRQAIEPVSSAAGGDYRLTIEERKRILMDHIFGVDIDPQAVEVTKLSLLLKVLEGEGVAAQLALFPERVLPDLGHNIKCGNSLIGPDFYDGKLDLPDEDATRRVNAFDWRKEFERVMGAGGFDAVIGNPPYIRIQALQEWAPLEVEHYKRAYRAASKGNYDIYVVFVEKGLALLNARGRLGFIMPHKFFNAQYGEPLRRVLAEGRHLAKVVHFGDQQVFANATTYTCLLFLDKAGRDEFQFVRAHDLPAWRLGAAQIEGQIPAAQVGASEWNFVVGSGSDLFERLRAMPVKLGDVAARMAQGIRTSANEVYVLDVVSANGHVLEAYSEYLGKVVELECASTLRFLQGRDIKAYRIKTPEKVVVFPYKTVGGRAELILEKALRTDYPRTFAYLQGVKKYLQEREHGRFAGSDWYAYGRKQNIEIMSVPKILVPDIADRAAFAWDAEGEFAFTSGYGITLKQDSQVDPKYVLGLVNSRLLDFYLKRISTTIRGGFFRYFTQYIEQLPIRPIDFTNPTDKARHDRMVALVTQQLDLHARHAAEALPHEKAALQRRIDTTDRQIDRLVYELYALTDAEIAVVEGGGS